MTRKLPVPSQLYPQNVPVRNRLILGISIGVFITLFILVFKPLGIGDWKTPYIGIKIAGFGLLTSMVLLFRHLVLPGFFRRFFSTEHWTITREILIVGLTIFMIAGCNYSYLRYLTGPRYLGPSALAMLAITFLIGIFPVMAGIVLNYIYQLHKYLELARALPSFRDAELSGFSDPELVFVADGGNDKLVINYDDFLFLEAGDNYVSIHYLLSEQERKKLIRASLNRLETYIGMQIPDSRRFVRCHRSYLVNLQKVEKCTGNAQGFRFHIRSSDLQIPVGRKYNEVVKVWAEYRNQIKSS